MNCNDNSCGIPTFGHAHPHHDGGCHSCKPSHPCHPLIAGLVNVIDNLDSTRTRDALSANMGRKLRIMVEENTARIEVLEERVDDLTERLVIVEGIVEDHEGRIKQLEDDMVVVKGDIVDIKEDIVNIVNRLDGLDGSTADLYDQIEIINGKIAQINNNINTINNRLDEIDRSINTINNKITNMQGDITNIKGDIANINNKITGIQGDISNIKNDLTDITNTLSLRIDAINNKMDTIEIGAQKNVQSDWSVSSSSSDAYIRNKPSIPPSVNIVQSTGSSTSSVMSLKAVTDAIVGSGAGVQSNWNETNTASYAYIQNKPAVPSVVQTTGASTATVMSQKAVTDALGGFATPVQSNWNETNTSSLAFIQNKPAIPAVVQTTGTSTTNTMSQKAITDALGSLGTPVQSNWTETDMTSLAFILNKPAIPAGTTVVLTTGQSTTSVMSQKAVTDLLNGLSTEIANISGVNATNSTAKLFLVGATTQVAKPVTNSNTAVYTQAGNVFGSEFYRSSDIRLKSEIKEADAEQIIEVPIVDYKKGDIYTTGVIAQEVQKVYPELTQIDEETGILSIDSMGLLFKYIKSLQDRKCGASILHKSVTILASDWVDNKYTVTDKDVVENAVINAYPAYESQATFELAGAYADLRQTDGSFIIEVRSVPTSSITIKYSIIS